MSETKLYFPYVEFEINGDRKKAHQMIFEALLANGPAYTIVVHESDEWRKIEDEVLWGGMLEIINKDEEEKVTTEVNEYFSPCLKNIPFVLNDDKVKLPPETLTFLLRKSLSQIVIASNHNAWIYGDEIICEGLDQAKGLLSQRDRINSEGVKRVDIFKNLLQSYQFDRISHLSTNDDSQLFHDFKKILDESLIKDLSKSNYKFGIIEYKIDKLELEIREKTQRALDFLKNEKIKHTIAVTSFIASLLSKNEIPGYLSGAIESITYYLKDLNLKKYAPPMIKEKLFIDLPEAVEYSLKPFNEKFTVFVPKH